MPQSDSIRRPSPGPSRRRFLTTAGAFAVTSAMPSYVLSQSPNETLNVACVGVGGRGRGDLDGVMSQNIVAICDVDERNLGSAMARIGKAKGSNANTKTFSDYRKMFDQMHKDIDAVVVATPDHSHGSISATAMLLGKHCYTEKPLAHNVYECRILQALGAKQKVATQMGTQIHAGDNYRRVVELIKTGAIGNVFEAHVWVGKSWSNGRKPSKAHPVPKNLDWDLWTDVAEMYPYAPGVYHPGNWRKFWNFGTGTLGDMACHYMDVVYWALDLHLSPPRNIWADAKDAPHPVGTPHALASNLLFPPLGKRSAVTVRWYDGGRKPDIVNQGDVKLGGNAAKWGSGVLFVGDQGMLLCDYGRRHLLPEEKFKDYKPPAQWIDNSIGHHNEWIKACKDGSKTTCNFAYSGQLSEAVVLGNVSYRAGKKLAWDAKRMSTGDKTTDRTLVRREYRKGTAGVFDDAEAMLGW